MTEESVRFIILDIGNITQTLVNLSCASCCDDFPLDEAEEQVIIKFCIDNPVAAEAFKAFPWFTLTEIKTLKRTAESGWENAE